MEICASPVLEILEVGGADGAGGPENIHGPGFICQIKSVKENFPNKNCCYC